MYSTLYILSQVILYFSLYKYWPNRVIVKNNWNQPFLTLIVNISNWITATICLSLNPLSTWFCSVIYFEIPEWSSIYSITNCVEVLIGKCWTSKEAGDVCIEVENHSYDAPWLVRFRILWLPQFSLFFPS